MRMACETKIYGKLPKSLFTTEREEKLETVTTTTDLVGCNFIGFFIIYHCQLHPHLVNVFFNLPFQRAILAMYISGGALGVSEIQRFT